MLNASHTHVTCIISISTHTHLNIRNHVDLLYIFFIIYCTLYQVQVTSTGTFNQNFMQLYLFILFCPVPPVPYGLRIALLYLLFTNLPTKQ